ncbi:phosphoribosylformylglycinamidine synthase subunit PurQ [Leucobacter sp. UCMA 4100]|uniref:phosphoribosylformylglycinamidine synthase subunit PurQ n=1 Tax=Leucobacter sp. UCMA 4100 TaxID=2810534 RepID=UPI0022EADD00|nr:phosphoribosylformylglycinamidine synthase subunit PurQ [Leucobacter sp. UCMA 4100]MDA3147756.1 phosphoribosylformylglycinamidine synthase subunit PurQ [Leucobacter sp. UCMA 4100]
MRVGVLSFPGSLDGRDAERAISLSGGEAVALWHADADLDSVDALVIPGGWSYGDYMRAGALAAMDQPMRAVAAAAEAGMPIIGLGNGFQILAAAEILPGTFTVNDGQEFLRADQKISIESVATPFTSAFEKGEEIVLPLRAKSGRYVLDADTLASLEDQGRIVARYVGENPNGSVGAVAAVSNERGNVVGIMPHPEFAVEAGFGPDTPGAMRSGIDGARFFDSLLATVNA